MFVKIPTLVVVAVTAGFCLGAPTSEATAKKRPLGHPGLDRYPKCGAPICKRAAQHNQISDEKRDLERRINCAVLNCPLYRERVILANGNCYCAPQGHIPQGAQPAAHKRDIATPESIEHDRATQLDQAIQDGQLVEINCEHRWHCPPGGHAAKINSRCLCVPNKLKLSRDLSGSIQLQQAVTQNLRRSAQDNDSTGPLDCASIAKCPANQHPVNNASDGMCECVDDDDESDNSPMDCAAISKCPADQHPVFNNNAGQCECIPDGTQLDCVSISQCSDGAHPINYNGMCICIPNSRNQQKMVRDLSVADTPPKACSASSVITTTAAPPSSTTLSVNTTVPAWTTSINSPTAWPTGPPKQDCTLEEDPGCNDPARCIAVLDPGCTDPGRFSVENFAGHCICRPNCTAVANCEKGLCASNVQVGNCGCYPC
ncbi:MAG: hypothetical protein Q9213_000673 [Squamulea squamosa]